MIDFEKSASEVRNRINAVLSENGLTQNSVAAGNSAAQKRLNSQLSHGSNLTLDTILRVLDACPDVSAEWLLRGIGDMRTLPDGLDGHEDVEIARLESTVETLLDRITGYKNRIKELEAALPEQKRNVG